MTKSTLYLTWLRIVSLCALLTGMVALLACVAATQTPWLLIFDILKWPLDSNPGDFDATSRALNAVLGGVLIGWSMLIFILSFYFSQNIRKAILYSLITWFICDSLGSYLANIPGNIILNVVFLIFLIVPLHQLKHLQ